MSRSVRLTKLGALARGSSPVAALGRGYARLEATERGHVWLNKLLPAGIFGLVAVFKTMGLVQALPTLLDPSTSQEGWLGVGYQASSLLFFALVTGLYLARRRAIRKSDSPLQGLVALMGTYAILPLALSGAVNDNPTVLGIATALMIVGMLGAAGSLAYLGRCFGIFPEARGLVSIGPYRLVRHPIYLFEFIAGIGMLLPALTPTNLLIYLVFVGLQLSRIVFEEQVLTQSFPVDYPAYRARTARLIPGIY